MIELRFGQTFSFSTHEKVQLLLLSHFRTILIIRLLGTKWNYVFFLSYYSALPVIVRIYFNRLGSVRMMQCKIKKMQ